MKLIEGKYFRWHGTVHIRPLMSIKHEIWSTEKMINDMITLIITGTLAPSAPKKTNIEKCVHPFPFIENDVFKFEGKKIKLK